MPLTIKWNYVINAALITFILRLGLAPEFHFPLLNVYHQLLGQTSNSPIHPEFCPDPKLLTDSLPLSVQETDIALGDKTWHFLSFPLANKPTDLLFVEAIRDHRKIKCHYTWNYPYERRNMLEVSTQAQQVYNVVGFHWWGFLDGSSKCRSSSIDTCAFTAD